MAVFETKILPKLILPKIWVAELFFFHTWTEIQLLALTSHFESFWSIVVSLVALKVGNWLLEMKVISLISWQKTFWKKDFPKSLVGTRWYHFSGFEKYFVFRHWVIGFGSTDPSLLFFVDSHVSTLLTAHKYPTGPVYNWY